MVWVHLTRQDFHLLNYTTYPVAPEIITITVARNTNNNSDTDNNETNNEEPDGNDKSDESSNQDQEKNLQN